MPGSSLRWRPLRCFIGLGVYAAVCLNLSLGLGVPMHAAVVMLAWLVFILVCAITDRANHTLWKRVSFILMSRLAMVWPPTPVARLGFPVGNGGFFVWTFPLIILAMRQSRLFVRVEG